MSMTTLTRPTACARGAITELIFCAAAGLRGWNLYTPFGHAHHVDVYIVRPGVRPIGVQVKTMRTDHRRSVQCGYGKSSNTPCAAGDFDVLAAYDRTAEEFSFWHIDQVAGKATISISTSPGKGWELLDTFHEG